MDLSVILNTNWWSYIGMFKNSQLAQSSFGNSVKKARLYTSWLGSICKRAELELGLARLVSSRAGSNYFILYKLILILNILNKKYVGGPSGLKYLRF
ncbi:hypothetical protein Hanom_Chr04g00301851 [Helianthus anomalus]